MQKRITASWSSADLAGVLKNLSTNQGVPIFLDRRIDPGQHITMQAVDTSVGALIYQLADMTGCGVCWLGDVAYVGPVDQVARLIVWREKLLGEIGRLSTVKKRKWLASAALGYPRLTNPAKLIRAQLEELGQPVSGFADSELPHDIWDGGNFPKLRTIDQLILISFGFDRWPRLENGVFAGFENTNSKGAEDSRLQFRVSPKNREAILEQLQADFPSAVSSRKNSITAVGDPLTLYQVTRIIAIREFTDEKTISRQSADGKQGTAVLSGRVKGSIESVLKNMASRMSVELQYDESLKPVLQRQVDLNANRVTHRELVNLVLVDSGLESVVTGKVLLIRKKDP